MTKVEFDDEYRMAGMARKFVSYKESPMRLYKDNDWPKVDKRLFMTKNVFN